MSLIERIIARGHPLIKATHPTTMMITRDRELGPRGDCIVAISADKAAADLKEKFKEQIRRGSPLKIILKAGGAKEIIHARGHKGLSLTHPTDLVIRKSDFLCERTLAIKADKAARDLSREFVTLLQNSATEIQILLEIT